MYCKRCGEMNQDGAKFCRRCGASMEKSTAAQSEDNTQEQSRESEINGAKEFYQESAGNGSSQYYREPTETHVVHTVTEEDLPEKYRPISMWGYFGYGLLFMIPLIGWIILIVFSVGGTQNVNLKNYARSKFCGFILFLLFIILMSVMRGCAYMAYIG